MLMEAVVTSQTQDGVLRLKGAFLFLSNVGVTVVVE